MIISWVLAIVLNANPVVLGLLGDYPTERECKEIAQKAIQQEHKQFVCFAMAHEGI